MQEDLSIILSTFKMYSIQNTSRISYVIEYSFRLIEILSHLWCRVICYALFSWYCQFVINVTSAIIILRQLLVDLPVFPIDHELKLILVLAVDNRESDFDSPPVTTGLARKLFSGFPPIEAAS